MRLIFDNKINAPQGESNNWAQTQNISFTGDAIIHLANKITSFNMAEWVWHIEIINGREWYIVTDKKA